jgi:hypothetical protein
LKTNNLYLILILFPFQDMLAVVDYYTKRIWGIHKLTGVVEDNSIISDQGYPWAVTMYDAENQPMPTGTYYVVVCSINPYKKQ